jgi:hypothetical protein
LRGNDATEDNIGWIHPDEVHRALLAFLKE